MKICDCGNPITTNKAVVKCAKCGEYFVDHDLLEVYILDFKSSLMREINKGLSGKVLSENIKLYINRFKSFIE